MTVTQERRQLEMIPEVWQRGGQEVAAETLTGLWSLDILRDVQVAITQHLSTFQSYGFGNSENS